MMKPLQMILRHSRFFNAAFLLLFAYFALLLWRAPPSSLGSADIYIYDIIYLYNPRYTYTLLGYIPDMTGL
jgi:hypothetical protein